MLAVGGALYLTGKKILKKRNEMPPSADDMNLTINLTQGSSPAKKLSSGDSFPLKVGSRGERVKQLQQAVQNILGTAAMSTFTKIDGIFGSGTLAALKAAGYGSSIDAATFQKIASLTGSSTATPVSSQNVGVKLYEYATQKNLEGVLSLLRQLQSVADYSAANKVFIDQQSFSVSRSIVTYLLDAFAFNDAARDQIKQEFLRIGLRLDNSTGKWSLSGFSGFKDIMTITDTYVQHASGQRFAVPRNTILGEQLRIANGMTTFRAIDGSEFSTPTQSVKYA